MANKENQSDFIIHERPWPPAITLSPKSFLGEPVKWWERDVIAMTISPPVRIGSKPIGPEKSK